MLKLFGTTLLAIELGEVSMFSALYLKQIGPLAINQNLGEWASYRHGISPVAALH